MIFAFGFNGATMGALRRLALFDCFPVVLLGALASLPTEDVSFPLNFPFGSVSE